eukprot:PLAT10611.3.p1 GENE.PLAT10611.3~~PLAT10611.3.p1  ORF type:complete len:568 (-),score=251.37 PLAT10611.3:41-1714(-)
MALAGEEEAASLLGGDESDDNESLLSDAPSTLSLRTGVSDLSEDIDAALDSGSVAASVAAMLKRKTDDVASSFVLERRTLWDEMQHDFSALQRSATDALRFPRSMRELGEAVTRMQSMHKKLIMSAMVTLSSYRARLDDVLTSMLSEYEAVVRTELLSAVRQRLDWLQMQVKKFKAGVARQALRPSRPYVTVRRGGEEVVADGDDGDRDDASAAGERSSEAGDGVAASVAGSDAGGSSASAVAEEAADDGADGGGEEEGVAAGAPLLLAAAEEAEEEEEVVGDLSGLVEGVDAERLELLSLLPKKELIVRVSSLERDVLTMERREMVMTERMAHTTETEAALLVARRTVARIISNRAATRAKQLDTLRADVLQARRVAVEEVTRLEDEVDDERHVRTVVAKQLAVERRRVRRLKRLVKKKEVGYRVAEVRKRRPKFTSPALSIGGSSVPTKAAFAYVERQGPLRPVISPLVKRKRLARRRNKAARPLSAASSSSMLTYRRPATAGGISASPRFAETAPLPRRHRLESSSYSASAGMHRTASSIPSIHEPEFARSMTM